MQLPSEVVGDVIARRKTRPSRSGCEEVRAEAVFRRVLEECLSWERPTLDGAGKADALQRGLSPQKSEWASWLLRFYPTPFLPDAAALSE